MPELIVNGQPRDLDAPSDTTLLEILRDDLGLTGTKYGCGEGQCGACTVLIAGIPVRSCQIKLEEVGNRPVLTIEGLEKNGKLHPVQQAFVDVGAMQCGYCVPGMIMRAVGMLSQIAAPTDAEIAENMGGNVCRCCGYPRMVEAIKAAAKVMKAQG